MQMNHALTDVDEVQSQHPTTAPQEAAQRDGAVDQRQQSSSALPTPRDPLQTFNLAKTGTGNLFDTPAASAGQGYQPDEIRRVGAGAGLLRASSEIRTKADHVPASWVEQRGEFVRATGPPPCSCHL